jgi:hypothetical protein
VYFIRSASLSAFCFLYANFSFAGGLIPLGLLVPLMEGQLSLQTRIEFVNGLKIQSHRNACEEQLAMGLEMRSV